VTASIDRVDFREPIYSGELVTCHAQVTYVGRTSLEVEVRVEAEDLLSRDVRHTNLCYLTFVAIDAEGQPIPVPPLHLETEDEWVRFHEGERRREVRHALAKELGEPG
jgi:acyl-CoA hydrolase